MSAPAFFSMYTLLKLSLNSSLRWNVQFADAIYPLLNPTRTGILFLRNDSPEIARA